MLLLLSLICYTIYFLCTLKERFENINSNKNLLNFDGNIFNTNNDPFIDKLNSVINDSLSFSKDKYLSTPDQKLLKNSIPQDVYHIFYLYNLNNDIREKLEPHILILENKINSLKMVSNKNKETELYLMIDYIEHIYFNKMV